MEPQSVLNTLDYIVIGVILLSAFLALMRGFVRELFSLIAWAGAYFVATIFYEPAIPWAHQYVKNEHVAKWVAMAGVFVVALLVLMIVGHFVAGFVKGKALTIIDRSAGFLYGLARGVLVVSLVYLGAVLIFWPNIEEQATEQAEDADPNTPPEFLVQAKTRPLMAFGAKAMLTFLPKEMIDKELQDIEAQKADIERMAREKALEQADTLDGKKGPIDIDALFKESNP